MQDILQGRKKDFFLMPVEFQLFFILGKISEQENSSRECGCCKNSG